MPGAILETRNQRFWSLVRRASPAPVSKQMATLSAAAPPAPPPDAIVDWLARAMLLYGVPLEYLVPHPAMLPEESLRFFVIDQNWLFRLAEGAASVGVGTSRDALQLLNTLDQLALEAASKAQAIRAGLRNVAAPAASANFPWSGLLLRSAVVQGWPGLEVHALDANRNVLPMLRMDRLTPNILLCLFNGIPAEVDILEPPETLHFGVRHQNKAYCAYLRGLGFSNPPGQHPAGIQFADNSTAVIPARGNSKYANVLDIAGAASGLKTALSGASALSPNGTFTSVEFAMQMIRPAGLQPFQPK
jgi:hypothetical protein